MAIRQIRRFGDSILASKSKPIKEMTNKITQLIDDMFDTLYDAPGVGLAAVQVGVRKRLFIVDTTEDHSGQYVFINPEITDSSGEQTGDEGCLSLPGKAGVVTRPLQVTIHALDRNMQPFDLTATELLARAICHEADHLDGILYSSKVEGELHDSKVEVENNS
jgi:peptide deformylase